MWNSWHRSDIVELDDEADRLYKIQPVLEHFVRKFKTAYKPSQ